MTQYLVTVKLDRNPAHDPKHKKIGKCPVNEGKCTDVTGQHHTFLFESDRGVDYVYLNWKDYHITRVEVVA
jgi:hypothetical protein